MATKKVKVEPNKIDFTNSVEKIKATTKTVNKEVTDTAYTVLEDLKKNTAKFRTVATETVNDIREKATLKNGVKFVKETAESVNDYSVETAEEILEEVVNGGKVWQDFIEKALKKGINLYGEQQEMLFDTLEDIKGQYKTGSFKLRNLLNFPFSTAEVKAEEAAAKAAKTTKKAVKTAKKTVTKTATKARKTVETAAKATTKPAAKKTTRKKVAAETVKATKDNLKTIEGIGPKIQEHLNNAGIVTFRQLADASQETLKEILAAAGPRYKMHNPITWSAQADLAAAGKMEALVKLQDKLKGGRVK